ncbi:TetR/AcrR family transcriptional regulator [Sinanaerobacter chloroacetimidivorans]|jgi:TetR/AcrR family transcriptional regulator|uniref:TetR/AcrR family transcriptional regulator n=1 Tax=Sinanaerobacter chloroacetimidivorans TaxID=2818044 RepID=A0A8J7W2R7_9FIRM|nr:TetR/AcrR family transcriptional regulator [Sinanaerobacter chloroacetimidivorans]MBR0599316.1 TetR/AcrR family transcriptional regulator [Sinanaerobacter chloroacetimidivorans]
MPTNTFYNLSGEKKDRIFDAALQEFSIRTFSQASLNQIIKNAGIPKGSFYQYFDNKEDLYLYMLEEVSKEKTEILSHIEGMDPDADVFEVIERRTREFLERGKVKPGYVEAAMLMEIDNSEFIRKIRKSSADRYVKMAERDKARGLIKPEVDSELVINMISTFNLNEYFRNGSDKERYLKNLGDAIKMIKEGVCL